MSVWYVSSTPLWALQMSWEHRTKWTPSAQREPEWWQGEQHCFLDTRTGQSLSTAQHWTEHHVGTGDCTLLTASGKLLKWILPEFYSLFSKFSYISAQLSYFWSQKINRIVHSCRSLKTLRSYHTETHTHTYTPLYFYRTFVDVMYYPVHYPNHFN